MEASFINYNGRIVIASAVHISPDNRSFRYGDGCFETMRLIKDHISLGNYHFERAFETLGLLKFEMPAHFNQSFFNQQIFELAKKNGHQSLARIRLTFFRGDGGLYDSIKHAPNFIIQSWALNSTAKHLNENGLALDFYKDAVKPCDSFSHLKTNNFLPYFMGALWAKQQQLNDCIILNAYQKIADSTIANIFIIKDGIIKTPPLTDGAVNGVMRRHLIKCIKENGMPFMQTSLTMDDVLQAAEVFTTNAINGIRWVKQVAESRYQKQLCEVMHQKFITPLFV